MISLYKYLTTAQRIELALLALALAALGFGLAAWTGHGGMPGLVEAWQESRFVIAGLLFAGVLYGMFRTIRRVRKRKEAALAAARNDKAFEALAQGNPDLLVRMKPSGALTFVSEASQDVLGFSAHELMVEGLAPLICRADRKQVEIALSRVSLFAETEMTRFRIHNRDGDLVWVELHARPIDAPNVVTGPQGSAASRPLAGALGQVEGEGYDILASLRDITATKRAEEELIRDRELSEAESQSKLNFLAGVSHELRTPLSAINGFSEVMMREMFGPMGNPKYVEYADLIHTSGEQLLDLINDLLDVSKIEAGRYELDYKSLFFPVIIESALRLVKMQAERAGVKLAVNLPDDLPRIEADPRAAKQILLNLLSNAIKFTEPGGTVTLSMFMDGNYQVLEVDDTGVGIAADDLARLGRPFIQAANHANDEAGLGANDRVRSGTGLGLALVRSLTELHKGKFHISSEVGTGTLVQVAFPVRAASEQDIDLPLPGILEASDITTMVEESFAPDPDLEEITVAEAEDADRGRPDFDSLIRRLEEEGLIERPGERGAEQPVRDPFETAA